MSAEGREKHSGNEETKAGKDKDQNEDRVRSVKRARRQSMNEEYEADDPIHTSKRKTAPQKIVKQPRKIKNKAQQTRKDNNNSKRKNSKIQKKQIQFSSSQSSSSSQNESGSSSSSQSSPGQKTSKPVIKKKNSKAKKEASSQTKRQNQNSPKKDNPQPNRPVSKAKGYVYKPPKPKPIKKQESINEIQRQFSRISRKKVRKSNFYLDKIDSMKWGEPVGRGAKKLKEQIQERNRIRREKEKQRKKQEKKARQLRKKAAVQSNQKQIKKQVVLSESDNQNIKIETKNQHIDKKTSSKVKSKNIITQNNSKFTLHVYVVQKLIDAYTKNAYDYAQFLKQLPHLKQDQIKYNMDILFEKSINKIQSEYLNIKQASEQIELITCQQLGQLLNELHKKKQFSSLLKRQNIEFNGYFNKTLFSITNPESELQPNQIRLLWNHITAFVRYDSETLVKKQEVLQIQDHQVKRQIFEIKEDEIKQENDLIETQNVQTKLQEDKVKQQNQ